MNWLSHIENELKRVTPGENPGRTRTIARRIAGIALKEMYQSSSVDFIRLLQQAKEDISVPDSVRSASDRLAARLDAQFNSTSVDPINDAMIVVEFVKNQISK